MPVIASASIPRDVAVEHDRHSSLPASVREAIIAAVSEVPALSTKAQAATVFGCSQRTIGRILALHGGGFKLNPDKRGAVRVPRALLVRVLCQAAQ